MNRLFPEPPGQGMIVLGYGTDGRICGVAVNHQHCALSWVKVWELVGLAGDLDAYSVAVMVIPTGPAPSPGAHELGVFRDLQVRARRAGLQLVDCFMWRGGRMWSLQELHEEQLSA